MNTIHVSLDDCAGFSGGWSVCPEAVAPALNAVTYSGPLQILELGSGAATYVLLKLLDKLAVQFTYRAWENDDKFVCTDKRVLTSRWNGTDFPGSLAGIYDLIIIDGPNGVTREKWYPLLRCVVRPGTVMLIDDFHHHPEFGKALNQNFAYDTISESGDSHECWKTVKIICPIAGR